MPHRPVDTILVSADMFSPDHLQAIREAAPEAQLVSHSSRPGWPRDRDALVERIEIVLGMLPPAELLALPKLSWVQQTGAGADWLLRAPAFVESPVQLANASGIHAIPIAEHVLALMLALSRRIHRYARAQQEHEWLRRGRLGELHGATIGIVGVGAIGEMLAQKARGLSMRVLGLRRDPTRTSQHVDRMLGPDGLPELLAESDWVVLAAAMTPETGGLIGESELRSMRENAYLINIARGAIVDEKALIRALQEGWIAGAGLDVFEQEPLPADSPLWDMRNVLITPHFAGATPHYASRVMEIFLDNLGRHRRGEPLRNLVDKRLCY